MAEDKEKSRQLKLRFFNIVIHPSNKHKEQCYTDLFDKIFEQGKTYETGVDRRTKIRTYSNTKNTICFTLVSFILYIFGDNKNHEELITMLVSFITSGFPCIIGFVLTGYAVLISFSNSELMKKMTQTKQGDHTYFEIVNSIFAIVLAIVVVTYIIGCFIGYVIKLGIVWRYTFLSCESFNTIVLFAFLFLFYYSIFALIDVIINIYNIGQIANTVAITDMKSKEEGNVSGKKENFPLRLLQRLFVYNPD